jgi:hypothetical protein
VKFYWDNNNCSNNLTEFKSANLFLSCHFQLYFSLNASCQSRFPGSASEESSSKNDGWIKVSTDWRFAGNGVFLPGGSWMPILFINTV